MDDAFITYTFARNVAEGHGFVWSPGSERLYGPTTFLWTIILAAFGAVGLPIPDTSIILGALSWALVSAIMVWLVWREFGGIPAALTGILLSISLYPSTLAVGMETGLYTLLIVGSVAAYSSDRLTVAGVLAALTVMTRPDGVVLIPILAGHFLLTNPTPWRQRLIAFLRAAAPGMALLVAYTAFILLYFRSPIPSSVAAKAAFSDGFSQPFDLQYVASLLDLTTTGPFVRLLTAAFTALTAVGLFAWLTRFRERAVVLSLWALAYVLAFYAGDSPSAPWYYAPLFPVVYAWAATGGWLCYRRALHPRPAILGPLSLLAAHGAVIVLLSYACFMAWDTYERIRLDPLGDYLYVERDERRRLGEAILEDMNRRGLDHAEVMAYEVGWLGWMIPGRVHDLLGLVSPEVVEHGLWKDPLYLLRYNPDYAVLVDANVHTITGPLHRSLAFQSRYTPIMALPYQGGYRYMAYRRRDTPLEHVWSADLTSPPHQMVQVRSAQPTTEGLIIEPGGEDPQLVYRPNLPAFADVIICFDVTFEESTAFQAFTGSEATIDPASAITFPFQVPGSYEFCGRPPAGRAIQTLRVDPTNRLGRVTIHRIDVWAEPKPAPGPPH